MDIFDSHAHIMNSDPYSVSKLSADLKRTVEGEYGCIRLKGEVCEYRGPHKSGHAYFSLKDEKAVINAVIWRGNFQKLSVALENGKEVVVLGKVTCYANSSKYQIIVERLEISGIGSLQAMLEATRQKLQQEGLFALERKKKLPFLPKVIGVITSPTGAVIRDILHRLRERCPLVVLLCSVTVQGEKCPREVKAAIEGFNALDPNGPIARPDLLIIARGGGSFEDLAGFNDEALVRSVVSSKIPIISAIGHETDTTLIDFAADLRAPTPTAAAELAVPVKSDLEMQVKNLARRLNQAFENYLRRFEQRIDDLSYSLPRLTDIFDQKKEKFQILERTYKAGYKNLLLQKRASLKGFDHRFSLKLVREDLNRRKRYVQQLSEALLQNYERCLWKKRTAYLDKYHKFTPKLLETCLVKVKTYFDVLAMRKIQVYQKHFLHAKSRYETFSRLLQALSYQRILERGFVLALDQNHKLIKGVHQAVREENFLLKFYDGQQKVSIRQDKMNSKN